MLQFFNENYVSIIGHPVVRYIFMSVYKIDITSGFINFSCNKSERLNMNHALHH